MSTREHHQALTHLRKWQTKLQHVCVDIFRCTCGITPCVVLTVTEALLNHISNNQQRPRDFFTFFREVLPIRECFLGGFGVDVGIFVHDQWHFCEEAMHCRKMLQDWLWLMKSTTALFLLNWRMRTYVLVTEMLSNKTKKYTDSKSEI